jgi:hypothetical protein
MLEDGRNIYSMRANAAGDKVAVGQSGGYLSTVDLATGTVTGPYDTGLGSLRAVDWCGSDIIVGSLNGDIGSYRPAWSENWETTTGDLELVWSVRSDGSGKFVAGDDAGNLFLYRCSDGAQLDKEPSIGGDDSWELYGTAWAPDGTQVAVAGQRFAYVYPVSATSFGSRTALTGFESTRTVFATDYVLDRNGDSTIVTGCTWVNYFAPSGGSATAISYAGDTYSLAWNPVHRILAVGYETQAKLINLSDDLLPPDISVIPGSVTVPYGTDSIVLEITVEDASFLRELTVEVNGVPILGIPPIPPEQYSASRDVEVDLNVDPNDVVIRAWDLYRNEAEIPITITRLDDTTGPMISDVIVSPSIGALNETFTIAAYITDEMPIADVEAHIQDIGENDIAVLPMRDDGTGGDAIAGDGTYTALWDSTGVPSGFYLLDIHAEDTHLPPNETYLDNCALFEVEEPTPPQYTIIFYTDPTNGGTITFDGSTYGNGQNTTKPDGLYPVSTDYDSSYYEFDQWTTAAGVSVLDPGSPSTTANVSGDGSIKAWFTTLAATVDISVVLQGGSRPPEAWEVPITIRFFEPGADVMTDLPVYQFDLTTTKVDSTAICQCVGIVPGTYEITARASNCPECEEGNCTLTNVKRSVVISAPSTAVDMGTLLAGDANCDGIINISDFGILAVSYMCSVGEPCYDCRADFDCNGIINISDFGLLAVNYMEISPVDIS